MAARWFPDQSLTIVPLALGRVTLLESAEQAILVAANIGGASDSVSSIAAGILRARHPDTVNQRWLKFVESVNEHALVAVGHELARSDTDVRDSDVLLTVVGEKQALSEYLDTNGYDVAAVTVATSSGISRRPRRPADPGGLADPAYAREET